MFIWHIATDKKGKLYVEARDGTVSSTDSDILAFPLQYEAGFATAPASPALDS
jgi:hypothetical protein